MRLTFAVQQGGAVAEITISLSAGGCATPFDLADMSDEIKLALAPQLAQLSERMSAASIANLKERALNEKLSFTERRSAARKYEDLTGEELVLLNAPSFPGHPRQRSGLNRGLSAGSDSADLALVNEHVAQPDALAVGEHDDITGVQHLVSGDTHGSEPV